MNRRRRWKAKRRRAAGRDPLSAMLPAIRTVAPGVWVSEELLRDPAAFERVIARGMADVRRVLREFWGPDVSTWPALMFESAPLLGGDAIRVPVTIVE
jgi:hypothetical protein